MQVNQNHIIEVINVKSVTGLASLIAIDKNLGYFIFCIAGHAEISIDSQAVQLKRQTLVNIISGAQVVVKATSSTIDLIIISYNEPIKNILSAHSLVLFCPASGLLQTTLLSEEFSDIMFYTQKVKKHTTNEVDFETALLNLILIVKELSSINNLHNSKRRLKNEIILSFNNLLDQSYRTDKSIESYCLQLHISPKKLYRAFKEDLGISPKEFMNFKLNMEAKKLLTHSTLSIKEVSNELGFQSPYYFTNFFKKSNNTTPTLFKEKMSDFSIRMS